MRPRAALALVAALLVALVIPVSRAGGQTQVDLTGSWNWSNTSNQTSTYSGTANIQHNVGAGTFTIQMQIGGPDSSSTVTGNGTVSGTSIQIQTDPYGSSTSNQTYTAQYQGTISENGTKLQGTWEQSDGQDGTFIATKTGSPTPTPTPTPSETGSADLCVKVVAQQFDASNFYEHDSCANTATGEHQFIWHERFPLLISITNRGPDTANNVKARVTLPQSLKFSDDRDESPCGTNNRVRTCSLSSIASGATKENNLLRISSPGVVQATAAEIQVLLLSPTPDPNPMDNEASAVTTVLPGGADLETRAGGPARAEGSKIATHRAVLVNNGSEEARRVRFEGWFTFGRNDLRTVDSIDTSRSGCEQRRSGFLCEFRRVPATRSGEVVVTVRVVVPNKIGAEITLHTEVTSDTPDPISRNNRDKQRTSIT